VFDAGFVLAHSWADQPRRPPALLKELGTVVSPKASQHHTQGIRTSVSAKLQNGPVLISTHGRDVKHRHNKIDSCRDVRTENKSMMLSPVHGQGSEGSIGRSDHEACELQFKKHTTVTIARNTLTVVQNRSVPPYDIRVMTSP
jgi:hypothetical protein